MNSTALSSALQSHGGGKTMLAECDSVKTTLIIGDPEISKAFLFEAAVYWAKEGQNVYYFAPKQLESLPLPFHERSEPSANALKLITFISASSYEDLASQLVRLHTYARQPGVLVVDGLEEYAPSGRPHGQLDGARLCALLLNSAASCSRSSGRPVRLCAATGAPGSVFEGYFDASWSVAVHESRVTFAQNNGQLQADVARLKDAFVLSRMSRAGDL